MPDGDGATSPYYIAFAGPIEQAAAKSLANWLCKATQDQREITVLFSSAGGSLDLGEHLYGLICAMASRVTMVASGPVKSVAVPVFLAAGKRIAMPHARFHMHSYTWTYGQQFRCSPEDMLDHALDIRASAAWTRDVLKSRANFSDTDFGSGEPFKEPLAMDATAAQSRGIVQQVHEFAIPMGATLFNMDW